MNTRKILGYGIFAVIIALAFAACKNEPDPTPHIHDWGDWSVTTPATCIAKGVETRTCKLDGTPETRDIAIDPAAHDWGDWTGTVTCETAGTGTRVCKWSATHTETDNNLPALGHSYLNYTVTKAATCSATGEEEAPCARDNSHAKDTRAIAIDGNAHDWETISGTAPTCTTPGSGSQVCSYNNTHTQNGVLPIDPNAHDWNDDPEIIPATATTNSVKAITCKYNGSHTTDEEPMSSSETGFEYATGSAGLLYTAINSNTAYRVRATSRTNPSGNVVIPAYYRPYVSSAYRPVTEIGNDTNSSSSNAFGGTDTGTSANAAVTGITFLTDENGAYKLTSINGYAFAYCTSLASVTIPDSVTTIGINTFYGCTGLTSVNIPAGVTTIGNSAFARCSGLTSVTIGNGVTSIGNYVFAHCSRLTAITVDAANPNYTSEGGILYNKGKTTLVAYPSASGSVTIPDSVTSIGSTAFYYCTGLTGVTIPDSVTSIGASAFWSCSSLTSVTFAGTIASGSFDTSNTFLGDLRAKYLAAGGGIGTYTRASGSYTWTKQ